MLSAYASAEAIHACRRRPMQGQGRHRPAFAVPARSSFLAVTWSRAGLLQHRAAFRIRTASSLAMCRSPFALLAKPIFHRHARVFEINFGEATSRHRSAECRRTRTQDDANGNRMKEMPLVAFLRRRIGPVCAERSRRSPLTRRPRSLCRSRRILTIAIANRRGTHRLRESDPMLC